MMNIKKYEPKEWAEFEGMTVEEYNEVMDFKKEPVMFYSNDDSVVAGVRFIDGTFGCFGCGKDIEGITEVEMLDMIEWGM